MTLISTSRRILLAIPVMALTVGAACSSGEATPTANPTATNVPVTVPTATATPQPTATTVPVATPTSTASPSPTPSPTALPQPSATPTVAPDPTATPPPTPDPRYGLIVSSEDARAFEVFGFADYIDYTADVADIPNGSRKIMYVNSVNPIQSERINASAAAAPGSVWYVLGEPNAHGSPVEDVLVGLHDTYEAIKAADPTALITSPSMLNFSFNCINCGGYHVGAEWIGSFRNQYIDLYGVEPPIDIWSIDVFPLVWPGLNVTAEQAFPTVRDDIVVSQVSDFRSWLDIWDASRGKPIWITEFGLHWGFTDWEFGVEGCHGPSPVGEYRADEVKAYLERVYRWLEENSTAMNIERWFTFSTYKDIETCQFDSGNGLTMLDSPGPDGKLTEIGEFYNNWTRGIR